MTNLIVHLRVREIDGVLFASSPDVPGLHVTGADRFAVRDTAARCVEDLFRRNRNETVKVSPTDDLTQLRVRTA